MATRHFTRSLPSTKQILSSVPSRSYTSLSLSNRPFFPSSLLRVRPLAAISASLHQLSPAATAIRCCSTFQKPLCLKDSDPQSSNSPTGQILKGLDFKHWHVVMEKPKEDDITRDEIIDSYIKTLAMAVGSEEEAKKKIYCVSTKYHYAFGALVSQELAHKIRGLPGVQWLLPDAYVDVENKYYFGEPFINGMVVPYDPKYHERVRHNDRMTTITHKPDKSRHSEKIQNEQNQDSQTPMANPSMQNPGPNMAEVPPSHAKRALDMEMPSGKTGSWPNKGGMQANRTNEAPNVGARQPDNMEGALNWGTMPPNNMGAMPPNNMGGMPNNALYSQYWNEYYNGGMYCNLGGMQANNMIGAPSWGGVQPNTWEQSNNLRGVHNNAPNFQNWNGHNGWGMPNNLSGMQANNMVGAPNWGGVQPNNMWRNQPYNMGGLPSNTPSFQYWNGHNGGGMPNNLGGLQPNNMAGAPSWGGVQPNNMWGYQSCNMGGVPNNTPNFQYWSGHNGGAIPYNPGRMQASNMVGEPNWRGVPPNNNMEGMPPYNIIDVLPNNMGGVPDNATNVQYPYGHNSGGVSSQNREMPGPGENREMPGPGANREYQADGNTNQARDIPGRDVPPPHQTINMEGVPNKVKNLQYLNGHYSGGISCQNREMPGPGENKEYQNSHSPSMAGGNTNQARDIPGRDIPPAPQTISRHTVDK